MARIRQRKGQRYVARTNDIVLIEGRSAELLKGSIIDESPGGVAVLFEGERPELTANQRVRVRCRCANGPATVRYIREESPTSFRVGIKWEI